MAIPVKMQVFEGPLDLLLHLIEKNKIDIFDIPIVEITRQYLAYVQALKEEDMNVTSEFMVMAAELLDIKARMLLPPDEEEEISEEDPRADLVKRLLEYKMYKMMSRTLEDLMDEEHRIFREPDIPAEVRSYRPKAEPEELLGDTTLQNLYDVFQSVLRRAEEKIDVQRSGFKNVMTDEVNVEEKIRELADYAARHRRFSFRKMLGKQKGRMPTIVMFLAILEFMKAGYIRISQKALFEDIEIETVEGTDFAHVEIEGDLIDEYKDQGSGD